jgi:hypothetical protein
MLWTAETRVEITPRFAADRDRRADRRPGRGYKPTARGRRAIHPLTQAAAAVEALRHRLTPAMRYVSPVDALFGDESAEELTPEEIDQLRRRKPPRELRSDPYQPDPPCALCDCGAPATVTYYGLRFCQDCVDYMEEQRGPRCSTCGDRGFLEVGEAGNSEISTNCPDCTPDY